MKKLYLVLGLVLMISLVYAQIDIKPDAKITGAGQITTSGESHGLIQLRTDPYFPCSMLKTNQIKCNALNSSKQQEFSDSLNILQKAELSLFGVPVTGSTDKSRIQTDETTYINVDLSQKGFIQIGFASNLFEITDLTQGVFNQTVELGGDVEITSGNLNGNYFTEIIDLNSTKTITNISFASAQPAGTEITLYTRAHNMTNGTQLMGGLINFYKMTSSNILDFSGLNRTAASNSGTAVVLGQYDNAIDFAGGTEVINFGDVNWFDGLTEITFSFWVNYDSTNDNRGLISKWGPGGDSDQAFTFIQAGGGDEILWAIQNNNNWQIKTTTSANIGTGTWTHIVGTFKPNTDMKIYVNAVDQALDVAANDAVTNVQSGTGTNFEIGYESASARTPLDGKIDEVMIWNRTLTSGEVTTLFNNEMAAWSGYSSGVTADFASITVNDGRYVQVRSDMERDDTGKVVELNNITLGFQDPTGVEIFIDNPPQVFLNGTPDSFNSLETSVNINYSIFDDWNIQNSTLWLRNSSGVAWHSNATNVTAVGSSATGSGVYNFSTFFLQGLADGTWTWNIEVYDNATPTQSVQNAVNYTFTVSTACIDTACAPFVCNNATNSCFTSCTSHDNVNESSYCNAAGGSSVGQLDTTDCALKEWSGLVDDRVCNGNLGDAQLFGFCFDDTIGTVGEFCTADSTGCVNDGTEFGQGARICGLGGDSPPNDFQQCLGGESAWDSLVDCTDLGDPFFGANGTTFAKSQLGHNSCGFFDAATCSVTTGCSTPGTNDCGSQAFNETSSSCLAVLTTSCDTQCGAAEDLETCTAPNTLSADCSTCTPPAVDVPPSITLVSPEDSSTQRTIEIDFSYTVSDVNMTNASLYYSTDSHAWSLNSTNGSAVNPDGITLNGFQQNFTNGANITWNIWACDDKGGTVGSADQCAFSALNFTFFINTEVSEKLEFVVYNESETASDLLFSVDEFGDTDIANNLNVSNDIIDVNQILGDPTNIPQLNVSTFLDIAAATLVGVRIDVPFAEHIGFTGKNGIGNLLIQLSTSNPRIFSQTGDIIEVGNDLYIDGDLEANDFNTTGNVDINNKGNLTVTGNLSVDGSTSLGGSLGITGDLAISGSYTGTNLAVSNNITAGNEIVAGEADTSGVLRVFDVNPDSDTQIAGGFNIGDGGCTIDSLGNIFCNGNVTLQGGAFNVTAGDSIIGGNILPDTDNIYDVGSTEFRWRTGYIGTDLFINRTLDVDEGTFYVDGATNFLGIGTRTPATELHFSGSNNPQILLNDTDPNQEIWLGSVNGDFQIRDTGNDGVILDINQAGLVGIGTTSASHLLNVDGDTNITGELFLETGAQAYAFTRQATTSGRIVLESQKTATGLFFGLMTQDGDGTDDVNFELFGVGTKESITGDRSRLIIKFEGTDNNYEITTEENNGVGVGEIDIYTEGNANQLVISNDGNVGINDATPDTTLDVTGTLTVTGASTMGDINLGANDNLDISDGWICVENLGGSDCPATTDGTVYADDFVEHSRLIPEFGIDSILQMKNKEDGLTLDYSSFGECQARDEEGNPVGGVSVNCQVKVLIKALQELYTENTLLKNEMCARDASWSWC